MNMSRCGAHGCRCSKFGVGDRDTWASMTKLLDQALEAVRRLPEDAQDEIARVILQLAGSEAPAPVPLSLEERDAIARSEAAAARGEFATEEEVRAVWVKCGL